MVLKQVIVVDASLNIPRGKSEGQVAHGAVRAYANAVETIPSLAKAWLELEHQTKIILEVHGEDELLRIYQQAKEAGLPCSFIRDDGRTVLKPGTATVVGIGPEESERIDAITGSLRLYR